MPTLRMMRTVLAVPATIVLLSACNSSEQAAEPLPANPSGWTENTASPQREPDAVQPAPLLISGKVLNVGYVAASQVCLDRNDNQQCDSGEPSTTTDANGGYQLVLETGLRGSNLLALIRPQSQDSLYRQPILQGWTLAAPLEYEADSGSVSANISLLSSYYHARLLQRGRDRNGIRNEILTRVGKTGDANATVDFDYAATPAADLSAKLAALSDYLNKRAQAATPAAPLSLQDSASVLMAWRATYKEENKEKGQSLQPLDAGKISLVEINKQQDGYKAGFFSTQARAASILRDRLVDIQGFTRQDDQITAAINRGYLLANGALQEAEQAYDKGAWTTIARAEGEYLTLTRSGALQAVSSTHYLQPRTITQLDGNRVSFAMPETGLRYSVDLATRPYSNALLREWVGVQLSSSSYGLSSNPAGVVFNTERDALRDAYVASQGGANAIPDPAAYAAYYDYTLRDELLKLPLMQSCGQDAQAKAKVETLGKTHCNWLLDSAKMHSLADLRQPDGLAMESWAKPGQTVQLIFSSTATDDGKQFKGTVTAKRLSGNVDEQVTEDIVWSQHPDKPWLLLLAWPEGAKSAIAGHFAAPEFAVSNKRKVAIAQVDGVLMAGQYFPAGYVTTERNVNQRALQRGMAGLSYAVAGLYNKGFR